MANLLENKVVIVTGSGRGVGECIAEYCAKQGAKVVVNDLGKDEDGRSTAELVAAKIKENGGEAIASTDNVAEWTVAKSLSRLQWIAGAVLTDWLTMPASCATRFSTSCQKKSGIKSWLLI